MIVNHHLNFWLASTINSNIVNILLDIHIKNRILKYTFISILMITHLNQCVQLLHFMNHKTCTATEEPLIHIHQEIRTLLAMAESVLASGLHYNEMHHLQTKHTHIEGYILNTQEQEEMLHHIQWIITSTKKIHLAVYSL